jgi:hypothetical protein
MIWQPIDTAPKDGNCVLLTTSGANKFSGMYVAYWSDGIDEWKYSVEAIIRNPTHWMPLPEAPKVKA